MNKFKELAREVSNRLRRGGIPTHMAHYSKHDNTVYINLFNKKDDYVGIRISNHRAALTRKYNIRSDVKQSFREKNGKLYLTYCLGDIPGMILRILKEKSENKKD